MSKRRVILVSPLGDPTDGAWQNKFEQSLVNGRYEMEYWGWKRYSDHSDSVKSAGSSHPEVSKAPTTLAGTPRRLLLHGRGRANWRSFMGYPLWMLKMFMAVMKERGSIPMCTTFDSALPCAVASLFRPLPFVFAHLDNMSKSFRWPRPIRWLIERLEHFTVRRCCMHILPSPMRWHEVTPKERFLPNSPTADTLARAREIAARKGYQRGSTLTVYVSGTLVATRGGEPLLRAVKAVPPELLRVLVAGTCRCPEIDELVRLPNVVDLGVLPMDEALALNYGAHLAFTYYDPTIELNRLAEPNKWEDCIATQTPFIVNDEVITARRFIEREACVHVPYNDWQGLADLLKRLAENREEWTKVQQNLQTFATPAWDTGLFQMLDELPWDQVAQAGNGKAAKSAV